MRSTTTRPSAVFKADHPEVFAAEDRGITPIEYLLVGLATCLTAGVAAVAQNRGIQLRSVEATVEGDHDIRGILGDTDVRNGYNGIRVEFKIDADARSAGHRGARRPVTEALGRVRRPDEPDRRTGVCRASAERVTAVVIGAGHAGLAASHFLAEQGVDHVVLERGEVANSWLHERWDSLRLLTPNWLAACPGSATSGDDPDGYMTAAEVASLIKRYAPRRRCAAAHRHGREVAATTTATGTGSGPTRVICRRTRW